MNRIFSHLLRSKVLVLTFLAAWGLCIEPASAYAASPALDYSFSRQVFLDALRQAESLEPGVRFAFPFGDRVVVNCQVLSLSRGRGISCEMIFGDKSFVMTDAEFKSIDCTMGAYSVGTEVKVRLGEQLMRCSPTPGDNFGYICTLDPSTLKDTSVVDPSRETPPKTEP